MGDITPNFSYHEFRPKAAPRAWKPNSEYQETLLINLVNNLQIVRSELSSGQWMIITNAVRLLADYNRLIKLGYRPSKTSDHNFGVSIPLEKFERKFKTFGETYNFAVGAADVQGHGVSEKELFNLSVKLTQGGKCDFGQVIYERNPNTGAEWVHYGGSLKGLFAPQIIAMINRPQFLKSIDGGRTYQIATSI